MITKRYIARAHDLCLALLASCNEDRPTAAHQHRVRVGVNDEYGKSIEVHDASSTSIRSDAGQGAYDAVPLIVYHRLVSSPAVLPAVSL